MKPDFSDYSLALIKDDKIVFSSKGSGLRPLVECIIECRGKYDDCVLHDKVIGLAAARLVVYSRMISSVKTALSSGSAEQLLKENKIKLDSAETVRNILNQDKSGICPMEEAASKTDNNESFFMGLAKKNRYF